MKSAEEFVGQLYKIDAGRPIGWESKAAALIRARDREIKADMFKRCKVAICKAMAPGDHKPEYYEGMKVALESLDSVLHDLG